VPIVATSDGIPNLTTIKPLIQPMMATDEQGSDKSQKNSYGYITDVALCIQMRTATMPIAMMDGKERSISPAMTTIVKGIAIKAKKGMVDMKAK
jgi:hypothetical protein